jgi:nucleoside-diphosphate kinase
MIKPDGVQRDIIGEIITRFERKGLKLAGMKLMLVSRELAEKHYGEHVGKPFYEKLVAYITSGPVVPMVIEGEGAVSVIRKMLGATDPKNSDLGTIRGDYGIQIGRNVVHGSDSLESAAREIALWFSHEEQLAYEKASDKWVYE